MTRIVAYIFEADYHCIACAKSRHQRDGFHIDKGFPEGHALDANGIPFAATDREGNSVHPVFTTDEVDDTASCGDCREPIWN